MSKLIYLSSLRPNSIKVAQYNHRKRITEDGIYSQEEIEEFVQELLDQKVVDLQDSLDADLYEYLAAEASGSVCPNLYSFQDQCNDYVEVELMNFKSIKEWLVDFWVEDAGEDMTDEEHEAWIAEIESTTDIDTLNEMLQGIGYYAEEVL